MIDIDIGDIVEFRCRSWRIRGSDGVVLELRCLDDGSDLILPIGVILADESFVGPDDSGPSVADQRLLDLASTERRRHAEFWYEHMYEVKHGAAFRDRGIVAVAEPTTTIEARLARKRDELQRGGLTVSMSTMWRRWRGFNERGVVGCIDERGMPGHVRLSNVDGRVVTTLEAIKVHYIDKSTPTKKQIIEIAKHRLTQDNVPVPGTTSMYELLKMLDRGEHTTGDATSRRSHNNSPDRAFGKVVALFPGEEVQLDSTPLDAMVLLADGQTGRVDLAAGIDVATGSITAAILRVNACKTVDALELWANSAVPQQMLPGWRESMKIARDYLPDTMASEAEIDIALESKPVIDVRGLVVDRGTIFVSPAFERATEFRGINCRVAPPYSPTAKPQIERLLKTIGDDFVRWIPGYKGRSVNHRGRRPEKDALWPLPLLQALLDEWIVTVYQNRAHAGLQLSTAPRMRLSPNAIYRALSESAPTPVRTLTRDEWICMHPHQFRRISRYGINLKNLIYDSDSPRFHQMRRTKSPNTKQKGKWEVRYDPNNLLQIWVRDEAVTVDDQGRRIVQDNGWIECRWVLAKYVTIPFGIDILHAVNRDLGKKTSDKRVLERAEQIHRKLLGGPPEPTLRPLTRAEATAGRANLARQELCTAPPPGAEPPAQPLVAAAIELKTPESAARVEPMRPMRLSEGW